MKKMCWPRPEGRLGRSAEPTILEPRTSRVDTTTICGTDLHILKGRRCPGVEHRRILGHGLSAPGLGSR